MSNALFCVMAEENEVGRVVMQGSKLQCGLWGEAGALFVAAAADLQLQFS